MSLSTVPQLTFITDYTEPYVLPRYTGSDLIKFNNFNKEIQYNILIDLMGAYMYVDFANDFIDENPKSQKYIDLLNGVNLFLTPFCDCNYKQYRGLKPMLIAFIWSEYLLHKQNNETRAGTKIQKTENSEQISQFEIQKRYFKAYNNGIEMYNIAYDFMYVNYNDYPEFITYHKVKSKKYFLSKDNIL